MDSLLILPGDPDFNWTLSATLPPNWIAACERFSEQVAFVCEPGSGLMRPASSKELDDYLYGGEYDEREEELEAIGDYEDELELVF